MEGRQQAGQHSELCFSFTVNTSNDIFQLPLNMMKCFIRLFIRNVKFVEDSNWAIGMFSFPENSCYTAESFWQLNQHKRIKKPKHSFFYFLLRLCSQSQKLDLIVRVLTLLNNLFTVKSLVKGCCCSELVKKVIYNTIKIINSGYKC